MSVQHDFYVARAVEARTGAADASLDNVRQRWIVAALAWEQMAARSVRCDAMRVRLQAEKAALTV